jgi:hypothetical protein
MKVRTLVIALSLVFLGLVFFSLANHFVLHIVHFTTEIHLLNTEERIECRNSFDKVYVVDDTGRVCLWQEVNYSSGCCPVTPSLFSCNECKNNCCSMYAYCVSCCLSPEHPAQSNYSNTDPTDKFSYCKEVCRFRIGVINEQWKSGMKYCFPRSNETGVVSESKDGASDGDKEFEAESPVYDQLAAQKPADGLLDRFSTISKFQKQQGDLLIQLEEELKKLIQANHILQTENKDLSNKLAQAKDGLPGDPEIPVTKTCSSKRTLTAISVFLLFSICINMFC